MPRRLKIFLILVLVLAGGYAIYRFTRGDSSIPADFTNARMQGALIAQNIVSLSNQSVSDIYKINELDREGDYTQALTITTDVINRSTAIRNQAVELSAQISEMTKALSSINDLDARQAALEAISSQLALLSRLINYSGDLGQLLDTLRAHFAGGGSNNQEVQYWVDQINAEVTAINNFNNQAAQSMARFDKLTGQ